jgi:hypothetical protein
MYSRKTSVRIAGAPAEMRTGHPQNTIPDRCYFILLGGNSFSPHNHKSDDDTEQTGVAKTL